MAHEEYRATAEELQRWEERNIFDWSGRPTKVLAPVIIADGHLRSYEDNIREWAAVICKEHGEPVEKIEAIPGHWLLDENFDTVVIRWTSKRGVFWGELETDYDQATRRCFLKAGRPYMKIPLRVQEEPVHSK